MSFTVKRFFGMQRHIPLKLCPCRICLTDDLMKWGTSQVFLTAENFVGNAPVHLFQGFHSGWKYSAYPVLPVFAGIQLHFACKTKLVKGDDCYNTV